MKILLVDDDVSIIQALLPALKSVPGHQVRAAISGEKAMENAEAWGGIDLLVTDIFMSPMNGFTLRNKLRHLYPEMRALFVTGYDVSGYSEHIEDCDVFVKPVDPHKLLRAISEMNITPSAPAAPGMAEEPLPIPIPGAASNRESGPQPFVPKPAMGPKPLQASVPASTATPAPVPVPKPLEAPVPAPVPEEMPASQEIPGHTLVGVTIGDYRILSELGSSIWGGIFHALQLSMHREVAMEILSPEQAEDPALKQQFVANASAKANVQHPFVLAVYEADDVEGYCFYTYEHIEGKNLDALIAEGRCIDEPTAMGIVKGVAGAMAYFHRNQIPHGELEAASIYLERDNKPRLANLATQAGDMPDVPEQIRTLARIIREAISGGKAAGNSLRAILAAMQAGGEQTIRSWEALIQLMTAMQPKTIPVNVAQLKAQEEARQKALAEAVKRQKRQILWSVLSLLLLVALIVVAICLRFFNTHENPLIR